MSPDAFVAAIRTHHLLEASQVNELTSDLLPRFLYPKGLAKELLARSWLTAYQINQLFQGNAAQLVLGPYGLLERRGEVFKARHQKMRRIVALKLIKKERLVNADAVKRFHREVRAAAALSHPNVVHAFDADLVGDTHMLVLEYVDGTDLSNLVKDKGPLPVAVACAYIRQAALGLQHAHEHGMVHRDIKPHNLILSVVRCPLPRKETRQGADHGPRTTDH